MGRDSVVGTATMLRLFLIGILCASAYASCHGGGGLMFDGDDGESGEIIPRGDIVLKVGEAPKDVFCRFNSSFMKPEDVFFSARNKDLSNKIVNDSTIQTEIDSSEPDKFTLYCKSKRKGTKRLCSQAVSVGYEPLDLVNLTCVSNNNVDVSCSWSKQENPVHTIYYIKYSVPNYLKETDCPKLDLLNNNCFWDKSTKFKLRDKFYIHVNGSNALGSKVFTHVIDIPKIVIPRKILSSVSLLGPLRAKVEWNLTFPMDVFHFGLWHRVENRMLGSSKWENLTTFFYKYDPSSTKYKRNFSLEVNLPYAFTTYEFRVRIHTGMGEIKEEMWSDFDVLKLKTDPLPPPKPPKTDKSSFEVVEDLASREIFVNFRDLELKYRGGNNFSYLVDVYSDRVKLDLQPSETTNAYFRFPSMNFTEYTFAITPTNEMGPSNETSEVIVPHADCMPKKAKMFTVIYSEEHDRTYSLYWVPSQLPNNQCLFSQSVPKIDSYTVYWCKKLLAYRCKERLDWMEIKAEDLIIKDLKNVTPSNIVIYEQNMTFPRESILSFGIAANSGNYSSGILWSNCIVDDSEPPLPPKTTVEPLTNDSTSVLVKWSPKCMSLSAVPVGFKISYCKSDFEDFGHCSSEVQRVKVNSPSSSEKLIKDLEAGTSYIFSVAVLSIIGEGRQSIPKIIRMREDVPKGPPLDSKVVSVSNTSVTLVWSPPEKGLSGGIIVRYKITTRPLLMADVFVPNDNKEGGLMRWSLEKLRPFIKYDAIISACTSMGCGVENSARLSFRTSAGVPENIENLILDVSNWHLTWDLDRCNSRNCSFQVRLPENETAFRTVTVADKETLSLREENVPCNHTAMTFAVRAFGQADNGAFLFGNWSAVSKSPSECPSVPLSSLVIGGIVVGCVLVTVALLIAIRHGGKTIKQAMKDWKQKINLPKGIQQAEPTKLKDSLSFRRQKSISSQGSDVPPLLIPALIPRIEQERGSSSAKTRADSVTSEEAQLIEDNEQDRHGRNGRNMSGSSDHSSGQDSALVASSPSLTPNEPMNSLSAEEMMLRQRSPGPPYVQHGILPEKLSEGYVTAWSVPSLPHLYNQELDNVQQSTPDLKANPAPSFMGFMNARRASTGYISMPDSDNDKDVGVKGGKDPPEKVPLSTLSRLPQEGFTGLPQYSRHSFSPEVKPGSAKTGYVTVMDGRSPSPPSTNNNVGYVSAGDPFGTLKRPPSLPIIPKSAPAGDIPLPLGAYCRVGTRANPTSQGYVSAGQVSEIPPDSFHRGNKNPPYVTCGEAASISASGHPREPPPTFSPYVDLNDGGKWANPIRTRPPSIISTPADIGTRVGQLPRPNTTEATMGHKRSDGNPSLSKQSSGYVSQETIAPFDAVVMSPKRLMSQVTTPHTIVVSPNHQASMV